MDATSLLAEGFAAWQWQAIGQLLLAGLLGGLVGMERQYHGRAAGFRTNLLVCVGCCLVMITSLHFARQFGQPGPGVQGLIRVDPARLAYSVMAGIGFLGAGAIIKEGLTVRGLTTAASMWCVAAVGLAVGFQLYVIALAATGLVLFALFVLNVVESRMRASWYKMVRVVCEDDASRVEHIEQILRDCGVRVLDLTFERDVDQGVLSVGFNVRLKDRHQTRTIYEALVRQEGVRSVAMT